MYFDSDHNAAIELPKRQASLNQTHWSLCGDMTLTSGGTGVYREQPHLVLSRCQKAK